MTARESVYVQGKSIQPMELPALLEDASVGEILVYVPERERCCQLYMESKIVHYSLN